MNRIVLVLIVALGAVLAWLILRDPGSASAPVVTSTAESRDQAAPPAAPPRQSDSARQQVEAPAVPRKAAAPTAATSEPEVAPPVMAGLEVTLVNLRIPRSPMDDAVAETLERIAMESGGHSSDGKEGDQEALREAIRGEMNDFYPDLPKPRLRLREPVAEKNLPSREDILRRLNEAPDSSFANGERPIDSEIKAMADAMIRRASVAGRVRCEVAPTLESPTVISGLTPGRYLVSVEIGLPWRQPIILGDDTVELLPGTTTRVTLELVDAPSTSEEPVMVQGTVDVPAAWGEVTPYVTFERLGRPDLESPDQVRWQPDQATRVQDSPGLYRWKAMTPPGRYIVTCDPFGFWRVFDVPPEGRRDIAIRVDAPANVQLHLVDAQTGRQAEVRQCLWSVVRGPTAGGEPAGAESADFDEATGSYRFRASPGPVEVRVFGEPEYAFAKQTFSLGPGTSTFTLRLERGCGVLLSLRDGNTPIVWPSQEDPILEALGGDGRSIGSSNDGTRRYLSVSAPGRYRLTLPAIEGYAPVAPIEIDIPPAVFVEREIVLHRED